MQKCEHFKINKPQNTQSLVQYCKNNIIPSGVVILSHMDARR